MQLESKNSTTSSAIEPLGYRVNEAAKALGISRAFLYQLFASGKLRSVKVAGRRIVPADAIRALLAGGE